VLTSSEQLHALLLWCHRDGDGSDHGWTTVIFALISLFGVSLIGIGVRYGPVWRANREQKEAGAGEGAAG
jgi:hypothetical protein